jgi:hypothetical protein
MGARSTARRPFALAFAHWRACALAGALASAPGCASEAQFSVLYGADFRASPHRSASVFGVYKGGRLTSEAWDEIAQRLGPAWSAGPCRPAFGDARLGSSLSLSGAVDDFARANGPTDDLLDLFGGAAKGDTILLVTLAGTPPTASRTADLAPTSPSATQAPISGYAQRRGRGALPGGTMVRDGARDRAVFEMSASLFSVPQHHAVAVIAMNYSGASLEEAYRKFGEKLAAELPGLACAGWRDDAPVDDARVRALPSEPK